MTALALRRPVTRFFSGGDSTGSCATLSCERVLAATPERRDDTRARVERGVRGGVAGIGDEGYGKGDELMATVAAADEVWCALEEEEGEEEAARRFLVIGSRRRRDETRGEAVAATTDLAGWIGTELAASYRERLDRARTSDKRLCYL